MQTIFANFVMLKGTQSEIVFEFYFHFPIPGHTAPPPDKEPDARIVMNATALDTLAAALQKAKETRDRQIQQLQQQQQQQQKANLGFKPTGGGQ